MIETRLAEINRGTGIAIPFGVRAVWVVQDSKEGEAQIYKLLAEYRIRQDREFFRMEFEQAFRITDGYIVSSNIET